MSVAVHGNLVYVLNAEAGGSVQGFYAGPCRLNPLPGSGRWLGLDPTATPQFTNTPGQVAFSPDGSHLIVTTKANGSDIDVFGVGYFGYLAPTPVVNAEPGTVPFGVTFDAAGHLVVAEAGTDALATFALAPNGTVSALDAVATGQAATCWVAGAQGYLYASNAGSASESGYREGPRRSTRPPWSNTATDPGTVDAAASPGGQFLYVQTGGNGIVDGFVVHGDGSLTEVGSVTVRRCRGWRRHRGHVALRRDILTPTDHSGGPGSTGAVAGASPVSVRLRPGPAHRRRPGAAVGRAHPSPVATTPGPDTASPRPGAPA